MNIDKELLKGSTQILVLTLIQKTPMYGYEIIKQLEEKSSGVFSFKEGTLYPILHALESKGIIESFWSEGDNKRRRKYYKITKEGDLYLKQKKSEWSTFKSAVDDILWEGIVCV